MIFPFALALLLTLSSAAPVDINPDLQDRDTAPRYMTERVVVGGAVAGRPYSPAIRTTVYHVFGDGSRVPVSATLHVSGQIAIDPVSRAEVRANVAAETEQVLKNIRALVESAGFTMEDVVKCTVFLSDIGDYDAMNAAYSIAFPNNPPARECVAVKEIVRGFRVEISCIAQR